MVLAVEVYEIVGDCPVCEGKGERAFGKIPPVPCSKCGGLGKARKRINIPGVDVAALVAVIAEVGSEEVRDALWESETIVQTFAGKKGYANILRRLAAALGGGK